MVKPNNMKALLNYSLLCTFLLLSGCSTFKSGGIFAYEEVKPWHKAHLAEERMQLNPYPLENGADQKIFYSRESAHGGQGIGGGGCGCN